MRNADEVSEATWQEGTELPSRTLPAITRTALALYAGGSGDHNPLHIDLDFARNVAKMDDVIGHGMLTMALIGRYLTELVPQRAVRSYSLRFIGMSKVGDRLECTGRVTKLLEKDGQRCAEVELEAKRQGGETLATGTAVVAIGAT
ncbi:MaoC/PaaZ C-terminal domain-containing protein [Peristeroidobacter agariperforans]|uniref:MaoC/PaaZ C-terminal domain-containing protein n=1 Tax=Peristeroidobacter agariperforans TaxID=268404 RepID=UPI00101C354E|nr:MaoC/PaaZ C-terminal domain-containing protein [Peristeroidobacter agariperforans]